MGNPALEPELTDSYEAKLRAQAATALVDEGLLRAAGAHGIMRTGSTVQVVVGPVADTIASEIEDLL